MIREFNKGDIYLADLGDNIGSEQSGIRPVMVIQSEFLNSASSMIIVIPITSKSEEKRVRTHYYLNPIDGLFCSSILLIEQIRSIDKMRLLSYRTTIPFHHLKVVDLKIKSFLGLNDPSVISQNTNLNTIPIKEDN